ncbi:MAG: hypothetical protein ACX930_07980 [Erythrobacter sp.]
MLRLFISIDMVGSTQFKAQCGGVGGWLDTFRTFFTNLPLMVEGQLGFAFLEREETPAVDIWKVMGDELLFMAEPNSADEALIILRAVLRAMKLFEEQHYAKLPLRLKGTAWLAKFGEENIELEVPELTTGEGPPHVDYIGPDLDLGFRITKFARPALLALSLDLAEALLDSDDADSIDLYHVGAEPLKGVMFERPYPVVWLPDPADGFDFLPWELDACAMCKAVAGADPTPHDELRREIADMRHYLSKMHGIDRAPYRFGD